jgi:hypothetical protein
VTPRPLSSPSHIFWDLIFWFFLKILDEDTSYTKVVVLDKI